MAKGTIKFFNHAKSFGFIAPNDGGGDVFVHVSAVEQAGLRARKTARRSPMNGRSTGVANPPR
jgi:cold shock CspA family protein